MGPDPVPDLQSNYDPLPGWQADNIRRSILTTPLLDIDTIELVHQAPQCEVLLDEIKRSEEKKEPMGMELHFTVFFL